MMKKIVVICLICLMTAVQANAVLKEKDLGATLSVLKSELVTLHKEQLERMARFDQMNVRFKSQMLSTLKKSDQIALMLYSQKSDYVFDLTYACTEATKLYNDFVGNSVPFEKFVQKANLSIVRYNKMVATLKRMPDFILENEQQRADRKTCLIYAAEIEHDLIIQRDKIKETKERYQLVAAQLKTLNDFALKSYEEIRQNVFINGETPYYKMLGSFSRHVKESKQDFREKYTETRSRTHSEWRGPLFGMLAIFVAFYLIIVTLINVAAIRWLIPKRLETPEFMKKRTCINIASTVITFALVLMVLYTFFLKHNFFILAAQLLAEYSWMIGAISLSLIIRLNGDLVMKGMRTYVPMIVVGFVVFTFRITFLPNTIVNLIFPVVMLLCTVWQLTTVLRYSRLMPKSDRIYSWVSLVIMIVSSVMSWVGYTLMSVQLLIWWIMQLTAIQTITCVYDLLLAYEKKHIGDDANIKRTWFYDAIYMMIVPICGVYSVAGTIYWAASVFDLTEWCGIAFTASVVNIPGIIEISLMKLSFVVSLWFVFRYLIYLEKNIYIFYKTSRDDSKVAAVSLNINMIKYLGWGFYLFVAMVILHVNRSGIALIMTGLSTGIGFAMKDTLENLFYGISLMTGRVKIGDVIECDGVRGKVTNINYQSTMVETLDGSVMAFLNSQLFSKNFKNMTRNHGYELVKIGVGVNYGAKINEVREMITTRISTLDCYNRKKGIQVLFDNFGDSSVDLTVVLWVPVNTKLLAVSHIKEAVYNVLNENNVQIPFPQQDVYIHGLVKP